MSEPIVGEPTLQTLTLQLRVVEIHLEYQKTAIAEGANELREMRHRMDRKIDEIEQGITPGLGPRVSALEIAKSNLDGRFWGLAVIMVLLELAMQFWPLLKHGP